MEARLRQSDYIPINSILYELAEFSFSIANFLAIASTDTVCIGGGVAKLSDILFERIKEYTEELVFIANKYNYKIVRSYFIDEAVLVGAILLAADNIMDDSIF
ncbi:ROK family protein [Alkalibaculum sporogenes]|uniref:ROK family protein n=1 Tax=Alkalibaculum sporogenes TaxID=2655001 RepID=UPI003CCE2E0C